MAGEKDLGLKEMNMCCSVSHWARGVAFIGNRVPELIFSASVLPKMDSARSCFDADCMVHF